MVIDVRPDSVLPFAAEATLPEAGADQPLAAPPAPAAAPVQPAPPPRPAGVTYTGTDRADSYIGGRGNDSLSVRAGNDTLAGNYGNAALDGAPDADTIDGGEGDDLIMGGGGDDRLTGGPGKDTFVFALGDGVDTITDFEIGKDRIAFDGFNGGYADLAKFQSGSATVIVAVDQNVNFTFIRLENVKVEDLKESDFVFIDTKTNVEEPSDSLLISDASGALSIFSPDTLYATAATDLLV